MLAEQNPWEGPIMKINRRHLAIAGVIALAGAKALSSTPAAAESADEGAVGQAVEGLRKAIFDKDKAKLEALCADELSYGESAGRIETKPVFIEGVMGRKANLKSLALSDHKISVVADNAIARHLWTSESEQDGKTTNTKIGVLQVWQKQSGNWKLLARQAYTFPPPA